MAPSVRRFLRDLWCAFRPAVEDVLDALGAVALHGQLMGRRRPGLARGDALAVPAGRRRLEVEPQRRGTPAGRAAEGAAVPRQRAGWRSRTGAIHVALVLRRPDARKDAGGAALVGGDEAAGCATPSLRGGVYKGLIGLDDLSTHLLLGEPKVDLRLGIHVLPLLLLGRHLV